MCSVSAGYFVYFPLPHRGQVAHGHVQGLNWVEGDLQPAADQGLLQQAPWHFGQPTDGHLEDPVLPLAWDGYFKIHLEKTAQNKRSTEEASYGSKTNLSIYSKGQFQGLMKQLVWIAAGVLLYRW